MALGEDSSYANRSAIRCRLGHTLALFWILPWVTALLVEDRSLNMTPVSLSLENFRRSDLADRPGAVLMRLLCMIDEPDTALSKLLDQHADEAARALR